MSSVSESIRDELQTFNIAASNHAQAYHSFLQVAQSGDWEAAGRCQLCASAMLDSAMDAYMRACRLQIESEGQEDS